jgi:uncharacterized protein (TIGR02452 family)
MRKKIAEATLKAISNGYYTTPDGATFNLSTAVLKSQKHTVYHSPTSNLLSDWHTIPPRPSDAPTITTIVSITQCSTLTAARSMATLTNIGVLNFASAKKPGGGFLTGAEAQEESLARASTIYPSLIHKPASAFYELHKNDNHGCFYTHAMIYSPNVLLIRDDSAQFMEPIEVGMLTSAAVNAGVVREKWRTVNMEDQIEAMMLERMGRILRLFEERGDKNLVLGSFGTGVFRNSVPMVARLWADLLMGQNSRFKNAFDRIVFAIIDQRTCDEFKTAFEACIPVVTVQMQTD